MSNTNYFLMNKKTKVLKFNSKKSIIEGYNVLEIYSKEKLPYILKTNINRFTAWLDERPIPTNQEHLHFLLGNNIDRSEWNYKTIINLVSEKDKLQLNDMLVFDFIIENWDRHLSNFGMLINNDTQKILGLA
ncbi:hypothetical protein FDC35_14065 [Clostridium botulinum]|nr:hypothetical protein [Clostridium botulinum]NFP01968.1 hypothetical protein [Clostridium botulinum]